VVLNNTDLYATVKALSDELRKAGEEQWSSALNDAMSISSVPGEVLGETRLQLQRLQTSQVPGLQALKWQVAEALSYLDKVLGPSDA
jgi:hypothetical protein